MTKDDFSKLDRPSNPGKRRKVLAGVALAMLCLMCLLIGTLAYPNWRAKNNADEFCEEIKLNSKISTSIERFEKITGKNSALHYEFPDGEGHRFIFPGLMFDKAECTVWLNKEGNVQSKRSEMLYD